MADDEDSLFELFHHGKGGHQRNLALVVEIGVRLIQQNKRRLSVNGPRKGYALPLPSGEITPRLAYRRVIAFGKPENDLVNARYLERP